MSKIREYAKAIAALLGAVTTCLITVGAPPQWSVYLGSAAAVLTGIATFGIPNGNTDPAAQIAKNAKALQDAEATLNAHKDQAKNVLTDILGQVPIIGGPLAKQVGDLIP